MPHPQCHDLLAWLVWMWSHLQHPVVFVKVQSLLAVEPWNAWLSAMMSWSQALRHRPEPRLKPPHPPWFRPPRQAHRDLPLHFQGSLPFRVKTLDLWQVGWSKWSQDIRTIPRDTRARPIVMKREYHSIDRKIDNWALKGCGGSISWEWYRVQFQNGMVAVD